MEIKTSKFQITKEKYLSILLALYFKKLSWLLGMLFLIVLLLFSLGSFTFAYVFAFFLILYPIALIIRLLVFVNSEKNKIFYLEQFIEIKSKFLKVIYYDGNLSKVKLREINKVAIKQKYYLIYISPNKFFYLPKEAFQSEEDRKKFEKIV